LLYRLAVADRTDERSKPRRSVRPQSHAAASATRPRANLPFRSPSRAPHASRPTPARHDPLRRLGGWLRVPPWPGNPGRRKATARTGPTRQWQENPARIMTPRTGGAPDATHYCGCCRPCHVAFPAPINTSGKNNETQPKFTQSVVQPPGSETRTRLSRRRGVSISVRGQTVTVAAAAHGGRVDATGGEVAVRRRSDVAGWPAAGRRPARRGAVGGTVRARLGPAQAHVSEERSEVAVGEAVRLFVGLP
jgi:hypothetical protein